MAGYKAGAQGERIFRNTVNRGAYQNKIQVKPRGGYATK